MRTSHPDESKLMFLAFDLLHLDSTAWTCEAGLSERKRDLIGSGASLEPLSAPGGALLLEPCNKLGFEGVVSKRRSLRYVSWPSRNWVKTKCPGWKRINSERYRLFEGR